MTVLLVIPPSLFLLDERVFMSLGILRVAASLESAGHRVELLDLSGIENFEEVAAIHAARTEATHACLTATTPQLPAATKIVAAIRGANPNLRIVAGGPHVTLVHSAVKLERKAARVGRAHRALDDLERLFDVLVSGDGENAVFEALRRQSGLIDADEPKGPLFLTSKKYEESPLPARHLIDVKSYKYSIEGFPAASLIAQLGCLAAGTKILMTDGTEKSIEEITEGELVASYDPLGNLIAGPVERCWSRSASDMWELTTDNGIQLLITSEHPILTPSSGWVTVETLNVGEEVCLHKMRNPDKREEDMSTVSTNESPSYMPAVQQDLRTIASVRSSAKLVQQIVQGHLAKDARERTLAARWAGCNASKVGSYVARRAFSQVEHQYIKGRYGNPTCSQDSVGNEARRQKSDEACRGRSKGIQDHQGEMVRILFGADEEQLARRKNAQQLGAAGTRCISEPIRDGLAGHTSRRGTGVPLRWQRSVLDRSVSVGSSTQPGFRRFEDEASYSYARGLLALGRVGAYRRAGLRIQGVAGTNHLEQRAETERTTRATDEDSRVHARIISKRFIGRAEVFNITVCPGHCYVANGVIVHNCPFACGFCGGRNSNMLRRIRTRSSESIIAEIEHLHRTYGFTGFMLYDDELNVNKGLIELMHGIAQLQTRLGVEFRLRGFIKAELFNEKQAQAMHTAGFRWLLCGFEAADPRILQNINKKATREDNDLVIDIAHRYGLKVKALMSVGHPGESERTIMTVRDWLISRAPDDFDCTTITTYPGTPYYDEAVPHETEPDVWTYTAQSGDRLHSFDVDYTTVADYYKGDPNGGYCSYVFTDYIDRKRIVECRDVVERDVRAALNIPFNPGAPGVRYEHSMGQGALPEFILKETP